MECTNAEAIVDEWLGLVSSSPSMLDGKGWSEDWYQMIAETDVEKSDSEADADHEAALQDDLERKRFAKLQLSNLKEAMNADKSLPGKVSKVVDHHLETLGFAPMEVQDLPQGPERLMFLRRAIAGQVSPADAERSEAQREFAVDVACQSFVSNRDYSIRTSHFTESTTWPEFHRQLQDHTTNWQVNGEIGCPMGLTPYNGTWSYGLRRKHETNGYHTGPWIVLDRPRAFLDMKRALLCDTNNEPELTAVLVHVPLRIPNIKTKLTRRQSRLQQYRERTLEEHQELCDRTGGTGDGVLSSEGHPFDETFDFEEWIFSQDQAQEPVVRTRTDSPSNVTLRDVSPRQPLIMR